MNTTTSTTTPAAATQAAEAPQVTLNNEQRLYVINGGYSCLGFDACQLRGKRLADELGEAFAEEVGSLAAYERLAALQALASARNRATGWRAECELHPALRGLEGRRVEVTMHGEKVRFQVGRSTGWIPCHLQIHNARSSGGGAISRDTQISNLRAIR